MPFLLTYNNLRTVSQDNLKTKRQPIFHTQSLYSGLCKRHSFIFSDRFLPEFWISAPGGLVTAVNSL